MNENCLRRIIAYCENSCEQSCATVKITKNRFISLLSFQRCGKDSILCVCVAVVALMEAACLSTRFKTKWPRHFCKRCDCSSRSRVFERWAFRRHFGLESSRPEIGWLCSNFPLLLAGINFRYSIHRYPTWRPSSPSKPWTQIDHIAVVLLSTRLSVILKHTSVPTTR